MSARIFLVDTEATGPSPYSSVMTSFGIVDRATRATFYGVMYDSMPSAENAAIPVLTSGPGPRYQRNTDTTPILTSATPRAFDEDDAARAAVLVVLVEWLKGFDGNAVFMSDNNGFDWQWLSYEFDKAGLDNPFGFSSRRIGDLYAGLKGKWRDTSSWKRFRKTKHTHNPVDDSMGNAEALDAILAKYEQTI